MSTTFAEISKRYERDSHIQKNAGERLFALADIKGDDDVLDVGCGTGALTKKIRGITGGKVVGIDPYLGMIQEAEKTRENLDILYRVASVEEIRYHQEFDLIFCNSAFQWFRHPLLALSNCRNALRPCGRIVIQAPAKKAYCPNFLSAIDAVSRDPRTARTFASFRSPWFFLDTADQYRELFEQAGFAVPFSVIEEQRTLHTPEQVMTIFESGAAAGYLNQEYYDLPLDRTYASAFRQIVQQSFVTQADHEGVVTLQFHRIYIVAEKMLCPEKEIQDSQKQERK